MQFSAVVLVIAFVPATSYFLVFFCSDIFMLTLLAA